MFKLKARCSMSLYFYFILFFNFTILYWFCHSVTIFLKTHAHNNVGYIGMLFAI